MANRKRDIMIRFRVSEQEREAIKKRMDMLGTYNREAYLRKMALSGYIIKLDLPELKELLSLMRRSSNNLNQLTRRVHETGHLYDDDLEELRQNQDQLWSGVRQIMTTLTRLE